MRPLVIAAALLIVVGPVYAQNSQYLQPGEGHRIPEIAAMPAHPQQPVGVPPAGADPRHP